jgi:hypothetical protein
MKTASKVFEPDANKVHYSPPLALDQVTLCGLNDFIGVSKGVETTEPVNCWHCRQIVEYVKNHKFDRAKP